MIDLFILLTDDINQEIMFDIVSEYYYRLEEVKTVSASFIDQRM